MTRKKILKLVAIIAVFAMVLPLVLVSLNAVEDPMSSAAWSDLKSFYEEEIAPIEVTHDSFNVGETLYDPNLTNTEAGVEVNANGVPDGWLAVPDALVAYHGEPNGYGAAGGWADYSGSSTQKGTDTEANEAINTKKFAYTSSGLKASIGGSDFSLLMPTLKDKTTGDEVDDYVYTVKATFPSNGKGQFGLITGTRGSEVTYEGGTFHCYYAPNESNSWYYYHYGEMGGRVHSEKIPDTSEKAIPSPLGGEQFTLTVYHIDGINYFFLDDLFVHSFADNDYYNGATLSGVGLYFCSTTVTFNDITVKKASKSTEITPDIKLNEPTIRYCSPLGALTGDDSEGLRFSATVDKNSDTYKDYVSGNYATSNENVKFGMLLLPEDMIPENGLLTIDTPDILDTVAEKIENQDDNSLTYAVSLLNIPDDQRDRVYVARAYMKVKEGGTWKYFYSKTKISRSYVGVANLCYTEATKKAVRNRLDEMFEGAEGYIGGEAKTISFSVFADFHYLEGGYISSVADLESIFDKAKDNDVDFVLQAGDFCNDYINSPEIVNAYLDNKASLPVFGVLGNHDLENGGTMSVGKASSVTPSLTNRNDTVVWGTADGKIGDGTVAYYYFDTNGFRVICLDTNYYYYVNGNVKEYRHYPSWKAGVPDADANYAVKANCVGDTQRAWLQNVLTDAAGNDTPCIVLMHASAEGTKGSSQCGDYLEVQEIFRKANDKNLGTVLMVINGHHHTNHTEYVDGILYFDMNTTRNGAWYSAGPEHYLNASGTETFEYVTHDANGNVVATTTTPVKELENATKTWFFKDPMSAIVHVSSNGRIIIEGMENEWLYGIDPKDSGKTQDGEGPLVNSGIFNVGQR